MDAEQELSDEQCDRLVEDLMEKLALKIRLRAVDLNPDILAHHTLRRALVRVAYALGKAAPYCSRYDLCVCGSDTPGVRAGCVNWKTPNVVANRPIAVGWHLG